MEIFANGDWLPLTFAALMALAVLVYAILDGYDLGVGILMAHATDKERDVMISSIGPFWDANETWLVLAVGLLLIAFPQANGIVLGNLYMPVCIMLVALIIRGVSFDFRAKAKVDHKERWDKAFIFGSVLTAMCQGYMLAAYVIGFETGLYAQLFYLMVGVCVAMGYGLIGASWLVMKTEGALQLKAVRWGAICLRGTAVAIIAIAVATPLMSEHVFARWTAFPSILFILPLPLLVLYLISKIELSFRHLAERPHVGCWKPFAMTAGVFLSCLVGLAYSFFPYIVPGQLKIVDAASAPESLMFILVGALIVLPMLIGYTIFAYVVFHGKTDELTYN